MCVSACWRQSGHHQPTGQSLDQEQRLVEKLGPVQQEVLCPDGFGFIVVLLREEQGERPHRRCGHSFVTNCHRSRGIHGL